MPGGTGFGGSIPQAWEGAHSGKSTVGLWRKRPPGIPHRHSGPLWPAPMAVPPQRPKASSTTSASRAVAPAPQGQHRQRRPPSHAASCSRPCTSASTKAEGRSESTSSTASSSPAGPRTGTTTSDCVLHGRSKGGAQSWVRASSRASLQHPQRGAGCGQGPMPTCLRVQRGGAARSVWAAYGLASAPGRAGNVPREGMHIGHQLAGPLARRGAAHAA